MCRVVKNKPQGFTLFIVLIMMLVIAFIVIASMQSTNTEMRISSNDADRKFAFSKAEAALADGEHFIVNHTHADFDVSGGTPSCVNGLCKGNVAEQRGKPIWDQGIWFQGERKLNAPMAHRKLIILVMWSSVWVVLWRVKQFTGLQHELGDKMQIRW